MRAEQRAELDGGDPEGVDDRTERAELEGGDPDGVDDRMEPEGVKGRMGNRPVDEPRTGVKQRGGVRARGKGRMGATWSREGLVALCKLEALPATARGLQLLGTAVLRRWVGVPAGSVGALSDAERLRSGSSWWECVHPETCCV